MKCKHCHNNKGKSRSSGIIPIECNKCFKQRIYCSNINKKFIPERLKG